MNKDEILNKKISDRKDQFIKTIGEILIKDKYEVNFDILEGFVTDDEGEEMSEKQTDEFYVEMSKVDKLKHEIKSELNLMRNDITNLVMEGIND